MPRVSILLPVYNGADYLQYAMESILAQTFTDFEFLILNDGSTDDSERIIQRLNDARIRYVQQTNIGLTLTLNKLIGMATGEFLARMDQDDWSHPERLQKQVVFLESHPEVFMCGSWINAIDTHGKHSYAHRYPVTNHAIHEEMLLTNPFAHGSIMARKSDGFTYRTEYNDAEDMDNWARQCMQHTVANLPEFLYHWRVNPAGISHSRVAKQTATAARVLAFYRNWYLERTSTALAPLAERTEERNATGWRIVLRRKRALLKFFRSAHRPDLVHREWQYIRSLLFANHDPHTPQR